VLHAKLRNRTCQGLDRQGQGQGLTSLICTVKHRPASQAAEAVRCTSLS